MKRLAVVVCLALTACGGGVSEEDALSDVRDNVVSDFFGTMDDNELTHFMRDICREIDDDGMEAVSQMWVGFTFMQDDGEAVQNRSDFILMTGNAVAAYCPEHHEEFDSYRDGSWAEEFAQIHE